MSENRVIAAAAIVLADMLGSLIYATDEDTELQYTTPFSDETVANAHKALEEALNEI